MTILNEQELGKKLSELKEKKSADLSSDEDLSLAVMNLISIEEHFFFTANKTNDPSYYDLLFEARKMRTELMKKLVKDPKGEEWCISKHLLSASYRLMEVGTKTLSKGDKKEADNFFKKAFSLYSMFWGINLKLITIGEVESVGKDDMNKEDVGQKTLTKRLGDIVRKVIDCCIE